MTASELFQKFRQMNVLVVGDVMLDRYLTGRVNRISPEAPVPVLEWDSEVTRLGGAANVAVNVRAFGASVSLCGIVGRDADGSHFLDLLPSVHLEDSGIFSSSQRITTVKTRIMAGSQQLMRLDKEVTTPLFPKEESMLQESIAWAIDSRNFNVIILQDYNKGIFTPSFIEWIITAANAKKIPVAVDPKFQNFWSYTGAALFKPNLKEVSQALGKSVETESGSLQDAANSIRKTLQNGITLITLGAEGVFIDDKSRGQYYPASKRNVADVCGAGDAVIAVAALALALYLPAESIAELANLAGGQIVEKVGVVPVDVKKLELEYSQHQITLAKS